MEGHGRGCLPHLLQQRAFSSVFGSKNYDPLESFKKPRSPGHRPDGRVRVGGGRPQCRCYFRTCLVIPQHSQVCDQGLQMGAVRGGGLAPSLSAGSRAVGCSRASVTSAALPGCRGPGIARSPRPPVHAGLCTLCVSATLSPEGEAADAVSRRAGRPTRVFCRPCVLAASRQPSCQSEVPLSGLAFHVRPPLALQPQAAGRGSPSETLCSKSNVPVAGRRKSGQGT